MTNAFRNFVAGEWRSASAGETFENENPARRGVILGEFQASGPQDMAEAVAAADAARKDWGRTPLTERQEKAGRFLELLVERSEELAAIVSNENGKTIRDARAEVQSAVTEGSYHIHQVAAFLGDTLPAGTAGTNGWVLYAPVGVAGIISPWNFPINVMCRKTLPALLTGNTVVFKPATFTPWSGVFMAKLFEEAGFPAGVFNCVTGRGSVVGAALVEDPRVRAISFTGSTAVGLRIQQQAAKTLTRTQLELGGKNAVIVMDDADLDAALDAVVLAGFNCSGQWCTSTSRALLHGSIHDEFLERLAERCESMVVGDPLDEKTDMGPVAGRQQYENICAAIERAAAEGARMVTGGPVEGAQGYFIRPTVFAGVTPAMSVFREEIFGPVVAATAFDDLDEALALANDSEYGLSSAIFTQDLSAAQRYIREIEAGMAHVNVHTGFKLPALPFGGWKMSGHGLPENGRTGLEFFVERKAVYIADKQ